MLYFGDSWLDDEQFGILNWISYNIVYNFKVSLEKESVFQKRKRTDHFIEWGQ